MSKPCVNSLLQYFVRGLPKEHAGRETWAGRATRSGLVADCIVQSGTPGCFTCLSTISRLAFEGPKSNEMTCFCGGLDDGSRPDLERIQTERLTRTHQHVLQGVQHFQQLQILPLE